MLSLIYTTMTNMDKIMSFAGQFSKIVKTKHNFINEVYYTTKTLNNKSESYMDYLW